MAKQKKKRKKKKRSELSKTDKILYALISNILTALSLLVMIFIFMHSFDIIKRLYQSVGLICHDIKFNGITILIFIFILILLISGIIYHQVLMMYDVKFKDFLKNKSSVLNKSVKHWSVYLSVLCVLLFSCLYLQTYARTDATVNNISHYHLIAKDTVTQYEEVDSAKLFVKMYRNRARSPFTHFIPAISVNIDGKEFEFRYSCFDYDYSNMKKFLELIGFDKVEIDKTNLDKLIDQNKDSGDVQEIYDLYEIN